MHQDDLNVIGVTKEESKMGNMPCSFALAILFLCLERSKLMRCIVLFKEPDQVPCAFIIAASNTLRHGFFSYFPDDSKVLPIIILQILSLTPRSFFHVFLSIPSLINL
eukprot:1143946-Pelagomonas_calceolata.AAC.5